MSLGVHTPSMPASNKTGCSPLVLQTFIHSPQRIQSARNSFSFTAPGGRIIETFPLLEAFTWFNFIKGVITALSNPVKINARFDKSTVCRCSTGCLFEKVILFSGHTFWHVIHRIHSPSLVTFPSFPIAPIPQFSTHKPQLVHEEETVLLNNDQSENSARIAPMGHIFLHQYRLNTMPAAINRTNTMRRIPCALKNGA